MYELLIRIRNTVIHRLYVSLLKPFFFARDPERVHDRMIRVGRRLGGSFFGRFVTRCLFSYKNALLRQEIFGITFSNPIGLSAGFDKNAELTDILPDVGFGFAELGSITGIPCAGNEGTRLWRLPKSKGLVVYYGLKNDGADRIAKRLSKKKFRIPIGISVAAVNKVGYSDRELATKDIAQAFRTMEPFATYITVNVSCPNTQTGQPFLDPDNLEYLLGVLDTIPTTKPVFIKLSPDLEGDQLDRILDSARAHRVQGIVCSNLTKRREGAPICDTMVPAVGGISGKVVQDRADELLSYIYKREGTRFVLIGSGGVFSAEDAYRKIRKGASLVQMITGMVFEGPQVISTINQRLAELLQRDGFTNVSQAVGAEYRHE